MDESILTSIKEMLGIPESVVAFDSAIIVHINAAFSSLCLLGVGPTDPVSIEDATPVWSIFGADVTKHIQRYVFLYVKLAFDPPPTSFGVSSMDRQLQKLEWIMNAIEDTEVVPIE